MNLNMLCFSICFLFYLQRKSSSGFMLNPTTDIDILLNHKDKDNDEMTKMKEEEEEEGTLERLKPNHTV